MGKATLKTQHDYLTVTTVFSKDLRVNLTVSRSGLKCSGKGLSYAEMDALIRAFDKLMTRFKGAKYSVSMDAVRACGEEATDVAHFVALLSKETF